MLAELNERRRERWIVPARARVHFLLFLLDPLLLFPVHQLFSDRNRLLLLLALGTLQRYLLNMPLSRLFPSLLGRGVGHGVRKAWVGVSNTPNVKKK
jgi:hypothetical protein